MCVLVGIGVVAFWPGEREPEYNGKKLSEWLDIATKSGLLSPALSSDQAGPANGGEGEDLGSSWSQCVQEAQRNHRELLIQWQGPRTRCYILRCFEDETIF